MKGDGALGNLASLANELPKKSQRPAPRLRHKRVKESKKEQAVSQVEFPVCFAEVTRLATSANPDDARKRAALEAVASTLPDNARSATGTQAAGIYLASLIVALRQVVTSASSKIPDDVGKRKIKGWAKLKKKKQRLQQAREERGVLEMSAMDARQSAVPSKDIEMTALDSIPEPCDQAELTEDAHFIANIVYLIALAARSSSRTLLNAKARDILAPVTSALMIPSPSPLLARHAAVVISTVISVLDETTWASAPSDISFAYVSLLSIASSSNPKNRKKARHELVTLLRKVPLSYFRPLCPRVATAWFKRTTNALIEECSKSTNAYNNRGKIISQFLHHVAVFRYFVFTCSSDECALIAKQLVTLGQNPIQEALPFLFNGLAFLFCVPRNVANDGGLLSPTYLDMVSEPFSTGIPDSKNWLKGQHPRISLGDAEKLLAAVVASTLQTTCSIESRTSRARALVTMSTAIFEYYPHTPPPPSATVNIVRVLINDIDPVNLSVVEVKQLSHFLHALVKRKEVSVVPEVFNLLEPLSTAKFQRHWNSLLPVLQECLVGGSLLAQPQTRNLFINFLRKLIEKRVVALAANDHAVAGLTEKLLGYVVQGGGASHVLEILPVKPDPKTLVTNAWVLSLFIVNIRRAPLVLWKDNFFPLHLRLQEISRKLTVEKHLVESKNLNIYAHQLVALLPGLCTKPSDISHSQTMNIAFEAIHYCMTYSDPLVQSYGSTALRCLSESIQSTCNNEESGSAASGLRSSFSSRLKKLFPTLLSLSEKQNSEKRSALLSALTKASQACADSGLVLNLLRKTIRRFLEAAMKDTNEMDVSENEIDGSSVISRMRHSASDLSIAILESGVIGNDASELDLLKRAVLPLLKTRTDPTLQKKAYKVLIALTNTGIFTLSKDSTTEIVEELVSSAAHVTAGAVSSRLLAIQAIIETLADSAHEESHVESMKYCVSSFLPESVLALRENSVKSRQSGLSLVKAMAEAWSKSTSTELGLENFLIAIAAGLGGQSTAMVSGSLVAMAYFLQEFKDEVRNQESLAALVDSMFAQIPASTDVEMAEPGSERSAVGTPTPGPIAILIRHDALEVQRSAIGVIKVAISTLGSPLSRLLKLLPGFLPSLVATAANSKKKEIRVRMKVVIERLLRKCGREVMEELFPTEHKRLLSSVRKAHEKEKQIRREKKDIMLRHDSSGGNVTGGRNQYPNSGFESDDSDDEKAVLDGNELIAQKQRRAIRNVKSVQERPGEVLDLLGNENIEIDRDLVRKRPSDSATRPSNSTHIKKDKQSAADNDDPLVFLESDEEIDVRNKGSDAGSDDEAGEAGTTGKITGRKRGREHTLRNDGNRKKGRAVQAAGAEYTSKKGAGDRKISNRPLPYAYVPLSSALNISSSSLGKGAKAKRRSGKTSARK